MALVYTFQILKFFYLFTESRVGINKRYLSDTGSYLQISWIDNLLLYTTVCYATHILSHYTPLGEEKS